MKILYFGAPWCGPCRMLSPKIKALVNVYEDVEFSFYNSDEEIELVKKYEISSVPTVIVLDNNENVIWSNVGSLTISSLEKIIEENRNGV